MTAPSLDLKENKCNSHPCGYGHFFLGRIQRDGRWETVYRRRKCKKWSCPECGPIRAKALQRAVALRAREHGLSRLLTLTLDPRKLEGKRPTRHLMAVWRKFRVYLQRELGQSVSFIWVLEFHKSGRPHLHVLVNRFIRQGWISSAWDRLGGGRIVDIRHVADLDKVGWYLGKYLSKDAMLRAPRGARRYGTSRDIRLFEREREGSWVLVDADMEVMLRCNAGRAHQVVREEDGRLLEFTVADRHPLLPEEVDPRSVVVRGRDEAPLPPDLRPHADLFEDWIVWRDRTDEEGCGVRQGVEQGAAGRGVLDSGPEKAAEGLRKEGAA